MSAAVILDLLNNLLKLGASPAIQQLLVGWLSQHVDISPGDLDIVVAHLKDAPEPKIEVH